MANVCDCKSLNDGSIPSSAFIRKLHYCFFNLLYYLTYLCAFLKSSSPFFNSNWLYKSKIYKEEIEKGKRGLFFFRPLNAFVVTGCIIFDLYKPFSLF